MQKRILPACFIAALLPAVLSASPAPMFTFSLGADRANIYSTKSITLIPPFQNSYIGANHYDTEPVYGVFLGVETAFLPNWAWQLGISYFQASSFTENGNVYQFSDPAYNNLTYQYQMLSRRVYMETKVASAYRQIWHPYVSAGVGEAFNKAYAYIETPVTSADVPMTQPFASHSSRSFIYSAGLGIDLDIAERLRLGVGYRFVDLGSASLGVTPLQSSTNTISNTHLYTNELMVQFSYFV